MVTVLDVHHHLFPIIQGGLEIKVKVTTSLGVAHRDKFLLLKNYIQRWYDFEESLKKDDSVAILKRIHDATNEREEQIADEEEIDILEMVNDEVALKPQIEL